MSKLPYRQGDVVLTECEDAEFDSNELPRDARGCVVLAFGESSGHAHRLKSNFVSLHSVPKRDWRILIVKKASQLTHEEHQTITLPAGKYRVEIKRQYFPDGWVKVAD